MITVKKGEVLFREGDEVEEIVLLVDGGVELTSTLGYSMEIRPGEIIGEWKIAGIEAQESATALRKSLLEPVDDEEVNAALELLLNRSFKRIALVNSNLSAKTKDPYEVSKIFKKIKKGGWKTLSELMRSPYYKALKKMREGDFEGAFETFMQMDKRSSPTELVEDSEIWKTISLFEFKPDVALRRYNALMRRKSDFSKYVSFGVLEKIVSQGRENLSTMYKLYLRFGMVIPSKTVICFEGEFGSDAYFILKGSPRVARYSSGEELIIAFLGPGEMVGEIAPIGNVPRTATVYTIHPIQVLAFESGTLVESIKEHPDFGMEILKVVLKRIERTKKLVEMGSSVMEKLRFLIDSKGVERLNETRITISEMASYLGLKRQEVFDLLVSKGIGTIKSDGTVRFKGE